MTFNDKAHQHLAENGLWPDEAEAVVFQAKDNHPLFTHPVLWERRVEDYPDVAWITFLINLDAVALEWIDRIIPSHPARENFVKLA